MMKLVLAIVQDQDAGLLCDRLTSRGFRATRINSVGGFLRRGNVTVLVGIEEERIEEVISVVRDTCKTRRTFINIAPGMAGTGDTAMIYAQPIEVEIGGASIFVLPVRRFVHLQGGATAPATDQSWPVPAIGPNPMSLVLAIVQNEDADPVTDALLAGGYRLTRIPTAGGFLRRGNATLLIGIEDEKVDAVLKSIQDNCKPRPEASPAGSGIPMYSATVFVLETTAFARV